MPMHDCVGVIIGGVQHTDGPLQVKYWGVLTPVTPAALTPMYTLSQALNISNQQCSNYGIPPRSWEFN